MKHLRFIWIEIMKDGFHSNSPICNMSRGVLWVWEHSLWRNKLYFQGSHKATWIITVVVPKWHLLSQILFIYFLSLPLFSLEKIRCLSLLGLQGSVPWTDSKLERPGHVCVLPRSSSQEKTGWCCSSSSIPIYNLKSTPRRANWDHMPGKVPSMSPLCVNKHLSS